ncbi:hypothetical protein GZ77_01040 [Endozoicomonas montiporae]|uniref:Uncharacterized protein n=1 Tax=Endozoicomonas montiporae TaxID=1027273 RepID=A0A081NA10_9GAMM|nr:hypothetical protein GZ77_01040 [Endozoicomonas montiporae]
MQNPEEEVSRQTGRIIRNSDVNTRFGTSFMQFCHKNYKLTFYLLSLLLRLTTRTASLTS